jgi:DNA-binding NarL/FixJ family response regulator
MGEAREIVASVKAMAPGLLESRLAGANYFAVPELAERYTRALRRAAGNLVEGGAPSAAQVQEGGISRPGRSGPVPSALDALTMREREVLRLVAQGLSNSGIASALELSEHTVKRHIANILMKLDLPTRAAAAALAARHGL